MTITLPDAGNRFMSMQVIDEDQYTHAVYYGAGRYTMTREEMGTRYGSLVIRILDMLQFFPIVARQTCLLK